MKDPNYFSDEYWFKDSGFSKFKKPQKPPKKKKKVAVVTVKNVKKRRPSTSVNFVNVQRRKMDVWKRDRFICKYCGLNMMQPYLDWRKTINVPRADFEERPKRKDVHLTVDHITPRSKGGNWDMGNLVTACFRCNQLLVPLEQGKLGLYEASKPILARSQDIVSRMVGMFHLWRKWSKNRRA